MSKQRHNSYLSSGFTLVELLVVIAIIGVLAAVILTSLVNGRKISSDSTIKNQLSQLFAVSQTYFSERSEFGTSTGTDCVTVSKYTDTLFADPRITGYITNIANAQNKNSINGYCTAKGAKFVIIVDSVSLPIANNGTAFCIDSTGVLKSVSLTSSKSLSDGLNSSKDGCQGS